ncbi:ABC transporter permease [Xanthomonas albilineans]|uniref:ABC transporter permease n=1 Tax=Xanthomonas albilineans TaxID=29447 RepID=UPI0005F30BFB|nr:FtsX-like permease family protein [Xanthomonas albilineans]
MSISEIPVIARSLRRHRLISAIFLLQIIITTAVISNVSSLLADRVELLTYQTGLGEGGLGIVETEFLGEGSDDARPKVLADLQRIREVPGVQNVAAVEALPLSQNNWTVGITNKLPDRNDLRGVIEAEPSVYSVSPGALQTLGIALSAGRDFSPDAYVPMVASNDYSGLYDAGEVIISKALAQALFPGESALGRAIFVDGKHPVHIVGVADHLSRPLLGSGQGNDVSMLLPLVPDAKRVIYAIRSDPDRLNSVLSDAEAGIRALDRNRMTPRVMSYEALRHGYFRRDRMMAYLFLAAGASLVVVTGIGVYGLVSFWVRQRYRYIGIRRSLGARSIDISRYFMTENMLLTVVGAGIGSGLAAALSMWVSAHYGAPKLPGAFLIAGFVLVCALGQLAAWLPARKAAKTAPVVTMRSV